MAHDGRCRPIRAGARHFCGMAVPYQHGRFRPTSGWRVIKELAAGQTYDKPTYRGMDFPT